jgi:MFS family permease
MRRNIKLLALFNFFTDFKLHSGLLIIYFGMVTNSWALAMSLFSITMVANAVFEVPTGVFSDKIGRKYTIVAGAISAVLFSFCYALGTSYRLLALGAVIEGLSRAWYSGNNEAFLYESAKEIKGSFSFSHYLGKTSAFFQLALMISAILGGFVANYSFHLLMWLSVIPQLCCLIISFFFKEPRVIEKQKGNVYLHVREALKNILKKKKLQLTTMYDVINYGVGEATFSFRSSFFATLWPIWAIGVARALASLSATLSFWFSGKVLKRISPGTALIARDLYNRTVDIISYVYPTVYSPALLSSTSLFYGVRQVAIKTLQQQLYSKEERATMQSVVSFLGNITYGLFALVLGILADMFSARIALIVATLTLLFVIPISWHIRKGEKA